jgi:hypothetical protein
MDLDRWGVLTTLALYADEHGVCYPSQAVIARALKRSRPWVNRVIGELDHLGFIQKTARTRSSNNGTTSCEYRIVTDPRHFQPGSNGVTARTPARHDDDRDCHRHDRTQSETKQNNPAAPSARDPVENHVEAKPADAGREPVPADWTPSDATMARARTLRPDEDLEAHAVMFASRSRAKDYRYAAGQIEDAWLSWLAEDRIKAHRTRKVADEPPRRVNIDSRRDPGERRFAAWATAAATPRQRATAPAPAPTRAETDNPWR